MISYARHAMVAAELVDEIARRFLPAEIAGTQSVTYANSGDDLKFIALLAEWFDLTDDPRGERCRELYRRMHAERVAMWNEVQS